MQPQSPAIVSELRLFHHSLVIYHIICNISYLLCNFSENCAIMAGCCNLIHTFLSDRLVLLFSL